MYLMRPSKGPAAAQSLASGKHGESGHEGRQIADWLWGKSVSQLQDRSTSGAHVAAGLFRRPLSQPRYSVGLLLPSYSVIALPREMQKHRGWVCCG